MSDAQYMWVSELNQKDEILGENHFPKTLDFYDTTLRDGEQTIGVSWDKHDKLEIAKMIDSLGVRRIEGGMPVVSKEDKEAFELLLDAGLKAEIWGFSRAVKGDIDGCIDVGVKHIICEIATSSIKMKANNFTEESVLKKVLDSLQHAKKNGLYTAFFAVDATRSDLNFLEKVYRKAVEEGGADEVVLVDTLGVATPETMFYLTKRLREWVDVPIMTHCHNDFGMATACTMFSVKGGAYCAQVTVNGLGEKTGNADLAETAIAAITSTAGNAARGSLRMTEIVIFRSEHMRWPPGTGQFGFAHRSVLRCGHTRSMHAAACRTYKAGLPTAALSPPAEIVETWRHEGHEADQILRP